jgi:DNA invertase Pin-like site-specific DNA recombinase/transposase
MTNGTRFRDPGLRNAQLRAAAYGRVSTADQVLGYGVADQDHSFDQWERENPTATVVGRFYDLAVSGALETRDEMEKVEALAHAKKVNCIVVPKVDRIGRTVRASLQWVWRMQDIGVHFISIHERIDTSEPFGMERFMRYVEFAEMEYQRIRERTMGGKEIKVALGGWPGGPAPYGLEIVGKGQRGSTLGPNAAELAVLEEAVSLIVDEGFNYGQTAKALNALGLFNRSGGPWDGANLHLRLRHTALDGFVTYRKTTGYGANKTKVWEDGTPVYGESIQIPVPQLLPAERVTALRAAMKRLEPKNARHANEAYPLSKRIHGSCGHVYVGNMARTSYNKRGYVCQGGLAFYVPNKEDRCNDARLDADAVEQAVWEQVVKLLSDDRRLRALAQDWIAALPGNREKYQEREASLMKQVKKQKDLIERQVIDYVKQGVDAEIMVAATKTLKKELADLETQLAEAQHWLQQNEHATAQIERISALASGAAERLLSMGRAERAEIIAMFDIEVTPQNHRITVDNGGAKGEAVEWHLKTGSLVPDEVSVDEWPEVEAFLSQHGTMPNLRGGSHPRLVVNGILLKLRTGIAWREVPEEYGFWRKVQRWQFDWMKRGVWPELVALLNERGGGSPVYRPPLVPPLVITGKLFADLITSLDDEPAESFKAKGGMGHAPYGGTGLEGPVTSYSPCTFSLTYAG